MRTWIAFAAQAAALLLTGCAISPGLETLADNRCEIPRYNLAVEVKGAPLLAAAQGDQQSFADALRSAYQDLDLRAQSQAVSPSMLFLSGGSQNGAFGAGFLSGWAAANGGSLPTFKVVTGISTGAIISTFAFLNETDTTVDGYTIEREPEILTPIGRKTLSGGLKIARKGAMGDLDPLRQRLLGLMDDRRMRAVAGEAARGRHLYVGAVDVDTAQAVVFDMTMLATAYVSAKPEENTKRERIRDCYVEAIMASSSVPLAALPVFIDNRMYIDGGARFGVFTDEIGDVIQEKSLALERQFEAFILENPMASTDQFKRPNMFVLINGSLTTGNRCGKANPANCPDHNGNWPGRHKDWNLLDLAERSVSILINQGYRFSSAAILDRAPERGFDANLVRIDPDVQQFTFKLDHPTLGQGERLCPEWLQLDEDLDRPIEFHPRYMRCLIAYGRQRGRDSKWADLE